MNLKIKQFHSLAKMPDKAHRMDAGFDLFSCGLYSAMIPEDFVLPPYETYNHDNAARLIRAGIGIELPKCPIEGHTYQAIVKGRSSLTKSGIIIYDGVIDNGYSGEIMIKVLNLTHEMKRINLGDKIAQLIIYISPIIDAVEITGHLSESTRGQNGFGSSGV